MDRDVIHETFTSFEWVQRPAAIRRRFGGRLIKGRSRWIVIRESGADDRSPLGFADQRSTRSTKRASERGVDRGPGYKLTHKGPLVINTRRTRGSDCINCRRKRNKTAGRMAAQSEFKAVCIPEKNVYPIRFIGRET